MTQSDRILRASFRHLARPVKAGAASVIVVFAILLALCAKSIFGLPLALILSSWFFKYAFILFDNTVRGFDEPPVLDIAMMNPCGEMRPLGMLLIVGGMLAIVWTTHLYTGLLTTSLFAIYLSLLLPASMAILGLEGNPIKAINPFLWWGMIRGLGTYYWLSIGLIAAEFAIVALMGRMPFGLVLQIAGGMFGTLSAFSLLAGSIYERRDQLGLVAWVSPELREEKQRREDHFCDERTITEAFGLMRASRHADCWHMLQAWLESQAFHPESYRWLTQQTDRWDDRRYSSRLSEDWIERLMLQKKTGAGLAVLIERLRNDPAFRPRSSADTLSLAQLAARGGGSPRTARILLSDFAQRFPGDPRTRLAAELASHLQ